MGSGCHPDDVHCADSTMQCSKDCNGEWGGTAFINDCNECVGGNTKTPTNKGMDCSGTCGGDAELDDCGNCSGGNTKHAFNSDMDCHGVCGGDAKNDACMTPPIVMAW